MNNNNFLDSKIKNICDFYALTLRLKNIIRTGWKRWSIDSSRLESVAEHIYGTQMLAFAVNSEFDLKLDIGKVIMMLAFHELGETIIGDVPCIDGYSKDLKHKKELDAVIKILEPLSDKQKILDLYVEFEERKTREAQFAGLIDKIECELQCKYYEEMGDISITKEQSGVAEEIRQDAIRKGIRKFSQMWFDWDVSHKAYGVGNSQLAKDIVDYALTHDIFKEDSGKTKK